jgi:hypothetical protein
MRTAALLRFVLLVAPLIMAGGRATAQSSPLPQDSDGAKPRGWLVGASIGVPAFDGDASPDLFTVAVHGTQLRPGRLGADFELGTMPRALSEGLAVGFARAGVALPVQLSQGVLLLPSAGVSLVGAAGSEDAGGTTGFNAGLAAVLFGAGSVGLRTGVTWHRFGDTGTSLLLGELGLVHIPRSR